MKCFVIMPFSKTTEERTEKYWTDHFKSFLKPKIETIKDVVAERSRPVRGDILKDIIHDLLSSEIVVADLTDSNPNVFYELGIRQSFKHGTITIAEVGTALPFDIKGKGVLFYHPKDHIKNAEFETEFLNAINDCINNQKRPDSIVLETIFGRGSFYELFQLEEITRKATGLVFEFTHNKSRLFKLLKEAKDKKENGKAGYSTTLFRHACIELLISHRYLSSNADFYSKCEKYYDDLISLNARLIDWPLRETNITKWFISREKSLKEEFESFLGELSKVLMDLKLKE